VANPNDDRFTVMVIALHNIAVEHEYLKQVRLRFINESLVLIIINTL